MVNTSPTSSIPAKALEYVYVCTSAQMPGIFKVGETHRQSPHQRAKQFAGIDKQVTWSVLRAFASPNSRYSEKLVHARLTAMGVRHGNHREMFVLDEQVLLALIEECVAMTPARAVIAPAVPTMVVVPDEPGPWRAALSLPVSFNGHKDRTLAGAMALAAAGNRQLQRRILEMGVKLVYPDPEKPHFLVYSLTGTRLESWLGIHGLSWSDLAIPEGGGHRKVKCTTQTGL